MPVLITELMPVGRGLMTAALLATVTSRVAAALNRCATLTGCNAFERLWPAMSMLYAILC